MAEKVQSLNAGNRAAILNVAKDYFAQVSACLGVEYGVVVGREVQCQQRNYEEQSARRQSSQELANLRQVWIDNQALQDQRMERLRTKLKEVNAMISKLYTEKSKIEQEIHDARDSIMSTWEMSDSYKKGKERIMKELNSKLAKFDKANPEGVKHNNITTDLVHLYNAFKEDLAFYKTAPEAQERLNQVKKDLDKLYDKYKNDIETLR